MKRIVVNKESLRALYPPVDAAFERDMRLRLSSLSLQREERRVKKKIGAGFAFAMLLMVLAATALAAYAVTQGFFAGVASIQLQSGYYDGWTLEEKEEVIRLMREYGIVSDMTDWDTALAEKDEARREAALDALFAERYGINGRTDVIGLTSILSAELGDMETWDMERKAWYTQLLLDAGLLYGDDDASFMPGEDAIPVEEAIAAAKEAVIAAYGLESGALDSYSAVTDCHVHVSQMNTKPPYYEIWLRGEKGEESYIVGVSQEGRILSSADGYLGVSSPEECAAQKRASEEAEKISEEERLAAHVAGMESLPARQFLISQNADVRTMTALADGSALVCGVAGAADGMLEGLEIRGKTPFALSVAADGTVLWKTALPFEGDVCAAMQNEAGDILLLIETDEESVLDRRYIHVRIGVDGALGETLTLPLTQEVTGLRTEYEHLFGEPGHDGLLIWRLAGTNNQVFYTQLDAKGSEVFTLDLSELKGYAPRLHATPEGYLLTAWNEQANGPILRMLDRNGQKIAEYADGEDLAGLRITKVLGLEDGSFAVTSHFAEKSLLARIGADGGLMSLLSESVANTPVTTSEILQVGGGLGYLTRHGTDPQMQHIGFMLFGDDGTVRELRIEPLEDMERWRGETVCAALDAHTLAIGQNQLEEVEDDGANYRDSAWLIFAEL